MTTRVPAANAPPRQRYRIVVTTSPASATPVEAILEAFAQAILSEPAADGSTIRITAFAREYPDVDRLSAALATVAAALGAPLSPVEIQPEPVCDWLALNQESFRPFRLGQFLISESSDPIVAPASAIHLRIDAGLAFGSGRHASTAGCLLLLSDRLLSRRILKRESQTAPAAGRSILDLGCGSGILAIAAAKLWRRSVLAVDVDRVAVGIAANSARRNGVGTFVHAIAANATYHPRIQHTLPFHLVFANILARPLRKMAPAISRVCHRGSILVLAGFLKEDATAVVAVYVGHGFRRWKQLTIDGWSTLVLVRR